MRYLNAISFAVIVLVWPFDDRTPGWFQKNKIDIGIIIDWPINTFDVGEWPVPPQDFAPTQTPSVPPDIEEFDDVL
jgi:hypothetical protein